MRLALLLALLIAAPAQAKSLFVYGDSMAVGTKPYLPEDLPDWNVRQDVDYTRHAVGDAPPALAHSRLAPVVHLSLGTVDDPTKPRRFRRAVRHILRIIGPDRCVVWANIARPNRNRKDGTPVYRLWNRLNRVLEDEVDRRDNLVIVDWLSMVKRHPGWMSDVDGTHVNEHGYRVRARMIARGVRRCSE
jgi:hypothetical protein